MKHPDAIFGRLGNRLFKEAFAYSYARDNNIDPYLQDPSLFEKHENELKDMLGDGVGYLPYVSIHLRVGGNPINPDEPTYADNPFYVSLVKTGYYIDAISQFPHSKFIVFSDDINFARTYLEGDRFSFDESETDIEAFNKMASCESNIIANSSFSWWAAYINKNPSKKVIAPTVDKWYSDGIERTKCPQDWLRI